MAIQRRVFKLVAKLQLGSAVGKLRFPDMKGRVPLAAAIEKLLASVGSRSFQYVINEAEPELGNEADARIS